ncbi:7TM-DISM domain-containing protein [Fibrella sp. WM1]|uniref:sensor histidine kinase n=1 Tax=Fibrella musci TaxID=3242485 RepID=UPI003522A7E0
MRLCWFIGWVLLTMLWAPQLQAQAPAAVVLTSSDDPREPLPIDGALSLYIDTTRRQALPDVQLMPFQPVGGGVPNIGYTGNQQGVVPFWLRFQVQNATQRPARLYAAVNFWCYESLQLFVVDRKSDSLLTSSIPMGWRTAVSVRPVHNRYYYFPFSVPPGGDYMVYLRVNKARGTQLVPITLIRQQAYEERMQRDYLFWGGVLLSLLCVSVMSLFFYITAGDGIYLNYMLCVWCLIGFFVINDGFLNQYAFDVQFWLPRQNIYFLFPLLLFYSQLVFVRTFLPMWQTPSRWLHKLSSWALIAGLVCVLMLLLEAVVTYPVWLEVALLKLFTVLYWLPIPIIVAFVATSFYRRYYIRATWLYLVAVAPFYVLNFGQVLANFDLIPTYRALVNFDYYAVSALLEVLVLAFGLAFRYKLMRDHNDRLLSSQREQERITYTTEVESLALRNAMLEEKERIARDLHDNVGAQLAFMITSLLHISRQVEQQPVIDGKQQANELRAVVGYARDAIRTLRETIWAIHQERFTLTEFEDRLNQYVNRYVQQTNGLEVDVQIDGDVNQPLTSVQVLNLFRIVQEALSNVVKHAQATRASVFLVTRANGTFHLTIHDNGRGLSLPGSDESLERHYGIRNMKRRAEELGGQFRIYSHEGTVVEAVRGN